MDSFKKLLEEEQRENAIPEQKLREIERKVHATMQPIRLTASTTELFIPHAIDTVMAFFGAKSIKRTKPLPPNRQVDPANEGL